MLVETIVFMQGDDFDEAVAHADAVMVREFGDSPYGYAGTAEWIDALSEYLAQWDYSDGDDERHELPSGAVKGNVPGYHVEYDLSYSWCALYREV